MVDLPLYRLPDLLAAPPEQRVVLVEGKKACNALAERGLVAVSLPGGASQKDFGDALAANPDYLDMLRVPLRQSPSPDELRRELQTDVDTCHDDAGVLRAIRRFRQRHALRVGANDVIRDRPLEEVTQDLSHVADAVLAVVLPLAVRTVAQRFGEGRALNPDRILREADLAMYEAKEAGRDRIRVSSPRARA